MAKILVACERVPLNTEIIENTASGFHTARQKDAGYVEARLFQV